MTKIKRAWSAKATAAPHSSNIVDAKSVTGDGKSRAKPGTTSSAKPLAATPVTISTGPALYQMKITLKGSKPPIWRRMLLPSNLRLDLVHLAFQGVMGWENYHLHEFKVGKVSYGEPDEDGDIYGLNFKDEFDFTLSDIAPCEKSKFTYIYDFGDGWQHDVVLEKVLPTDSKFKHPICIDGAMRCPMEDSGGIWGYYNKLEILADPKHEDHRDIRDWIGGRRFDPTAFDLKKVNARLKLA